MAEHSTPAPASFERGQRTKVPFPTVSAAFYHHARSQPDITAARDLSSADAREITYAELARRAIRLAQKLSELGVGPGHRVPLVTKRGIDMLVGIFGILFCGAQYVPLDGGVVPDSTLACVVPGCKVALCLRSTERRLEAFRKNCTVLAVDGEDAEAASPSGEREHFEDRARPEDGCYVIYTSGTTGTPKGVDVTHKNVTNLLCLAPGNLGIGPGTRVGQILNISFDMAAWEILGCLCNGGTLILRGSKWDAALKQMDVIISTPSILAKYDPRDFPSIRVAATAGEPSSQRLADLWATHATYYNCCGPTETTIVNTMHKHVPGQPLSIGKPTPNNNVYIINEQGNPAAIGEPGLMWAGGFGVTRGYVGLPSKTIEKYRLDPFANDGSVMYDTGDLGRWNEDGTIDILGRVDDQIKIKGFRVELDGVTASMNSSPLVARATALLIDDEIHGFLTPRDCDVSALKKHLETRQPYYAIPTQFHQLDALPITPNGKVDKKALRMVASSKSSLPSTITEILEKPLPVVSTMSPLSPTGSESPSSSSIFSSEFDEKAEEKLDLSRDIPEKKLPKHARGLVYRILIIYRQLFTVVGIFNIAAVVAMLLTGIKREWMGTLTASNLLLAVLVRQDTVINILYTITCSVPKSWPLWLRTSCGKIYHLGGLHSGAGFCAAAWLLASNISDEVCHFTTCPSWGHRSLVSQVLSWMLSALFLVMLGSAWPPFRKQHHDLFERTHRFVGWTMLGLFWVQTVFSIDDAKPEGTSLGAACTRTPAFWMLVVATMSIASSWLFLRKVPVDAEVLSDHAVRLHFDYTVPVNGSFTRLSHRPLLEWHSFATIPAPTEVANRPKGYSLVVSNAGDWTRSCIQKPPTHMWVRGVPTCGVMRIATLFNRVVVIATGSGIGPLLGHLQAPTCPTQLIWSTPKPEQTFGKDLIDAIKSKIPNAVIHDTKVLGRPDLVKMGYNLAKSFRAEAVIIIANEKITKKVVYGLETRGVPAYGAIWDS